MNAKQSMAEGTNWTAEKARLALPIMLLLAKTGKKLTYQGLDHEIARLYGQTVSPMVVVYGQVLEIIGRSINLLSEEWGEEIPPLTVLIVNKDKDEPSRGIDGFLGRYAAKSSQEQLTPNNRRAMIKRATDAVHNYPRWNEVATYFEIKFSDSLSESDLIPLEPPPTRLGVESEAHRKLKEYVANHPELFAGVGLFNKGQVEYRLPSGDEVDVLFQNDDLALAVEVKTADAPPGELTRGLYQCVKYRAVLRAMYDVAGVLLHVQAMLVTPRPLPPQHVQAVKRVNIAWQKINWGPGQDYDTVSKM